MTRSQLLGALVEDVTVLAQKHPASGAFRTYTTKAVEKRFQFVREDWVRDGLRSAVTLMRLHDGGGENALPLAALALGGCCAARQGAAYAFAFKAFKARLERVMNERAQTQSSGSAGRATAAA